MNGYQAFAETYARLFEKEPEGPERENLLKKVQAFKAAASYSDEELAALFDTGAFNDILKGYVRLAAKYTDLSDEAKTDLYKAVKFALSEFTASDAVNYLQNF